MKRLNIKDLLSIFLVKIYLIRQFIIYHNYRQKFFCQILYTYLLCLSFYLF